MTKGHNFDHDMRTKLANAAVKYLDNPDYRTELNSFIMELEEPYAATIRTQDAEIAEYKAKIKHLEKQLKAAV